MKYYLRIAEIRILIDSDYEIVFRHNTESFLTDKVHNPDFVIKVRSVDMIKTEKDGIRQGDRFYSDDKESSDLYLYCRGNKIGFHSKYEYKSEEWIVEYIPEYQKSIEIIDVLFGYIGIENILRYKHGFLLHSSLIQYKDHTVLFSAPSGTGKSTQASLWEKYKDAVILNGDRACVRKIDDTWHAYGTPYAGSSMIFKNEGAPVKALFILKQAKENRLVKPGIKEAVRFLFPEIVMHHWDSLFVNDVLNYLIEIINEIPVYILECTPDIKAVEEAMKVVGE